MSITDVLSAEDIAAALQECQGRLRQGTGVGETDKWGAPVASSRQPLCSRATGSSG